MKFALFLGCNIPIRLKQYETSSRAVLEALGVNLFDIADFNCCGYPLRNVDLKAFVLSAARNLALAEKQNLDLLVLCQCGYGTFRMAAHLMKEDAGLREEVNGILAKEGLRYGGDLQIKHLFTVLSKDIGVETNRGKITSPYRGLRIATHYGCHALRPSNIVQFDDPFAPSLFDRLVEVTGAESVDWPARLDCCGAPLLETNDELSFDLTQKKLDDAKKAGAHYMTTGCSFCQIQFDAIQKRIASERGTNNQLPAILYPQLLGLCMGIDKGVLGLEKHQIDITGIVSYLAPPQPVESA
jgi:heterodisulfide reductase subunit B